MSAEQSLNDAGALYDAGDFKGALDGFRTAARLALDEDDPALSFEARYWAGCALNDLDDLRGSASEFIAAIDGFADLEDVASEAECRLGLAQVQERAGATVLATTEYERALAIIDPRDEPLMAGQAHWALGTLFSNTDPGRARTELERAADAFERAEELMDAATALLEAFDLAIGLGDFAGAEILARRARDHARAVGEERVAAVASFGVGTALLRSGDLTGAEHEVNAARVVLGDDVGLGARCDLTLAQVARERRAYPAARALAEAGVAAFRTDEVEFAGELADSLLVLGTILALGEDRDAAERSFAEARERHLALGSAEAAADCAVYLIALLVGAGRATDATSLVAPARRFYASRPAEERWFFDYYAGGYHHAMGDSALALEHYSSAADALAVLGDGLGEASARMGMGQAHFGIGHAKLVAAWNESGSRLGAVPDAGHEEFQRSATAQLEAARILRSIKADPVTIGSALQNAASALVSLGRTEEALAQFAEARTVITAENAPLELAKLDFNEARAHLGAAGRLHDKVGRTAHLEAALALLLPAMLYLDAQRYSLARRAGRLAWTTAYAAQARQVALSIAELLGKDDLIEEILTATRAGGVLALGVPDVVPVRWEEWAEGTASAPAADPMPLLGTGSALRPGDALAAAVEAPGRAGGGPDALLRPGPLVRLANGTVALGTAYESASRRYRAPAGRLHQPLVVEPERGDGGATHPSPK